MVRSARLVLTFLVSLAAGRAAADAPPDPFKLYGNEMVFSVWRSGAEIGQHHVTFASENGALVVKSLFDVVIRLLGVPVYRYKYQSAETWRDGKLDQLSSTVDDDGTVSKVEAKEDNGKLAIAGPKTHEVATLPLLPSTHWNAQVIAAVRLLNTLNGKVDQVKLVPVGQETVPVGAAQRQATHYHYTGDIKAESWYDAEGHWLKLNFAGTDGTLIDYVCKSCMAPP
ncbi:MAG TPA: DUF6134 family protein [Stellaceae bacterium]|nr:DUF6134 family protein [Stellaceae bacterium]